MSDLSAHGDAAHVRVEEASLTLLWLEKRRGEREGKKLPPMRPSAG